MAATLTKTKKVANLTEEEYKACYSLNLRNQGLMRGLLQANYADPSPYGYWHDVSHHVYASLRYNRDGTLAGWALIFPDDYDNLAAYFYVRKNQRRKGVGKNLVKHVNKRFGQVRVYPHDKRSNSFFNFVHEHKLNVDIQDDHYYEDDWWD